VVAASPLSSAAGKGSEMKDTGYKLLKRASEFHFFKWGEYMKRAQIAERKVEKLKRLVLLTDPAVSSEEMNSLSAKQWSAFIQAFPDEASS
jgi:hypothetical protein